MPDLIKPAADSPKQKPNVLRVVVVALEDTRGVCPHMSSMLPMGVQEGIVGGQQRMIMQPMLVECLGSACRLWKTAPCGEAATPKEWT